MEVYRPASGYAGPILGLDVHGSSGIVAYARGREICLGDSNSGRQLGRYRIPAALRGVAMGVQLLDATDSAALVAARTLHAVALMELKLNIKHTSPLAPLRDATVSRSILAGDTVASIELLSPPGVEERARTVTVAFALNHGPVLSCRIHWQPATGMDDPLWVDWDTVAVPADRQVLTLSAHRLHAAGAQVAPSGGMEIISCACSYLGPITVRAADVGLGADPGPESGAGGNGSGSSGGVSATERAGVLRPQPRRQTTMREVARLLGHNGPVRDVAVWWRLAEGGRQLCVAGGGDARELRMWEVPALPERRKGGSEECASVECSWRRFAHADRVWRVSRSEAGVASMGTDGVLVLSDCDSGEEIGKTPMHSCNGGWSLCVAAGAGGRETIWTGGADGTVRGIGTSAWLAMEANRGTGLRPGMPEGVPLVPHSIAQALKSAEDALGGTIESGSTGGDGGPGGIGEDVDAAARRLHSMVGRVGGGCAVDVALLHGGVSALCATSINGVFAMTSMTSAGGGGAGGGGRASSGAGASDGGVEDAVSARDFESLPPVELISIEDVLAQVAELVREGDATDRSAAAVGQAAAGGGASGVSEGVEQLRSRTQVASMAVDARRGFIVLVTTMLTAHVFQLRGVTPAALAVAGRSAQEEGLLTGRLPMRPASAVGDFGDGPGVVPLVAFRLGLQRGNARVELLPEDLRQPRGDGSMEAERSSFQFATYLPSGIVSFWTVKGIDALAIAEPAGSSEAKGESLFAQGPTSLWLQGSYLIQAGQEPRELCSLDGGRVGLAVLGKSYCAVLLPFASIGVSQHRVALEAAPSGSTGMVPAGGARQASVLVDAYQMGKEVEVGSPRSSSGCSGMVPPAAILRLRKKDASLIHLRCVGNTAHVFLAESRATVFVAEGKQPVLGSSSPSRVAASVPMTVDKGDAASGAGGEVSEQASARILSWSLMQLSSEFNGDGPEDAKILPWQGYGDREQTHAGRDISSLSRRAQRRKGVSRKEIKARDAGASGKAGADSPAAAEAKATSEALRARKDSSVASLLKAAGVGWHPCALVPEYPRGFVHLRRATDLTYSGSASLADGAFEPWAGGLPPQLHQTLEGSLMLGKTKVEGRFLRVHASGVAEAASFGSFRAGLGGDFSIGQAPQRADPAMSYHGLQASIAAMPGALAIDRPVLSAAAGIAHAEGQKGLDAVEVLFKEREGRQEGASAVLAALDRLHKEHIGTSAATDKTAPAEATAVVRADSGASAAAPGGSATSPPAEGAKAGEGEKKKAKKNKKKKAKEVPLFRGLRYARFRCKAHAIGGERSEEDGQLVAAGPAVLGCPSHDRAGLHAAFLQVAGTISPLLCTVGEDMQVMVKRVQAAVGRSGASGPASELVQADISLQHVATLLGHTGSPRAVASCEFSGLDGGSTRAPLGLLVTGGAAKEVVAWALTPDRSGAGGERLVLPEFVAGLRLVGRKQQLLSISDSTEPSERLEPGTRAAAAAGGAGAASGAGEDADDDDDVEIAEQRITCSSLLPLELLPESTGSPESRSVGIGFAGCTSGQLLVFAAGPFFNGADSDHFPSIAHLCSVDLGQPLLSVKAVRVAELHTGSEFVVLCGGTGGVLFVARVGIKSGSIGEKQLPGCLEASVQLLGSIQTHRAGVNAMDARCSPAAGGAVQIDVLTAGDDECLCRLRAEMAPKAHRYRLSVSHAVRIPGASFAAMRGVHLFGEGRAVTVGVDSRALVWKLGDFGAGTGGSGVGAARAAGGRKASGDSASLPPVAAARSADPRPAHQLVSLIDPSAEAHPTLVDDEPSATAAAAKEAGLELLQLVELQVGDVGGSALQSLGPEHPGKHLLAINGQGCEVILLEG